MAAFLTGIASWKFSKAVDHWIVAGALLGLAGLLLKALFIVTGIGADQHDMTTHEITPGNPLLIHIHHLFFNVGFVCYLISAAYAAVVAFRKKYVGQGGAG